MEPLSKEVFFLNYGAMNTMIAVDFYFTIDGSIDKNINIIKFIFFPQEL